MAKAGAVVVQFTVNATNYSAGVQKIKRLNKDVEESVKEAGHATITQMQASSAAIRALENPIGNNIRAIERLATTIPGVGAALQAAFPVVGALALASVVGENIKKVVEFVQHLNAIPSAISMGYQSIQASMTETNDSLQVTIDKLDNATARMSKKPENALKLALDEAAVSADNLSKGLIKDTEELAKLLKENSVGSITSFFSDQRSTVKADSGLDEYQNQIKDIHSRGEAARYGANGDANKEAAADATERAEMRAANEAAIARVTRQLDANKKAVEQNILNAGTFDPQNASLNSQRAMLQSQHVAINQADQLEASQKANDIAAAKKASDEAALEASRKAQEAAKRAQEAQMRGFQDQFATARIQFTQTIGGNMPVAAEIEFWKKLQSATAVGSRNYIEIQKTIAEDSSQQQREVIAKRKKDHEDYLRDVADTQRMTDELPGIGRDLIRAGNEQQDKASTDSRKTFDGNAQFSEIQSASATALAQVKLNAAEANGSIINLGAAYAEAAIHAREYGDQVRRISDERANAVANPMSDSAKQQEIIAALDVKRAQLDSSNGQQSVQDANAIAAQSISARWRTALNDMANQFQDFGGSLINVFKQTVDSLNSEVVTLLSTRHTNGYETRQAFKQIGNTAFKGVASAGIRGAEGHVLGALGLGGKATLGTQGNPMYVRLASGVTAGADSAGSSIQGVIGHVASGVGGFFSKLLGIGASAAGSGSTSVTPGLNLPAYTPATVLPGFADGGDVSAGMMALVGERGPEIVRFGAAGRVVPNGEGTGGVTIHHHIDARGSTNPMETKRQIQMALAAARGPLIKQAVMSGHEYSRRRPSSAR